MPEEDIAFFPMHYGENYLYLLEVDPSHLHVLWQIIPEGVPDLMGGDVVEDPELFLRIYCLFKDSPAETPAICYDVSVEGLINTWFVAMEKPVTMCRAELGYADPETGAFISICFSNKLDIAGEPVAVQASAEDARTEQPPSQEEMKHEGEDQRQHLMEYITERDVIEYYRDLPEKTESIPGLPPWRSLLERYYSEEALRTLRLFGLFGEHLFNPSPSERHSSPSSAMSFPPSTLDPDR
ncbi:MAG: DUF4912 domain-containing protein [bacterium]